MLQEFGIPVRHELAGVGQNLQDHLQIRMIYEVNVPTLNDEINNWFRRSMIGMDYVFRRRGPMALGAAVARRDLLAKRRAAGEESAWLPADSTVRPDLERAQRLF